MGRSFHNEKFDDEHDRRKTKKKINSHKKSRHHDKAHLKEYTSNNLTDDDFLDMEEDGYERKPPRV